MMEVKSRNFKKVSKEEFENFVKNHKNFKDLDWNIFRACEPPLGSYNDFSNGKVWPESMVAKISLDWMGPNGEIDKTNSGKFYEYFILDSSKENNGISKRT